MVTLVLPRLLSFEGAGRRSSSVVERNLAAPRSAYWVVMGLTSAGLAVAAFFAAMLVGFAFGAAGMALSTFMRSWQDFDLMVSAQFALFLFSGTFVPAQT